jgi:beta-glucosidase
MKMIEMLKKSILLLATLNLVTFSLIAQEVKKSDDAPKYLDVKYSFAERAADLVSRLTLEEKIMQMQYNAPAVPRLGIPEYNWWNECLHGVARNGIATVFPQAIGMAATWNPELIHHEADIISTEARAKYYEAIGKDEHGIYQGLTFWSPNINIFRDPRWGRGQETYGEDPFLTASIGKAFVTGLQGDDSKYFKVISTAKHFAVHSGPEPDRHHFDAWPSMRDLYETYLPAFEALVKEAKVYSVMSCYNRVYATPASGNTFLLKDILRDKWDFKGYIVSDCWAVSDFYNFHKFVPSPDKASALAVRAGCDLACGNEYVHLNEAIKSGYLNEADIDRSLTRLFVARMKLGMFDPPSMVPYASILPSANNTKENSEFARKVAHESIVLLKNENNLLPLSKKVKKIAVIGPYANDTSVLLGNYNGVPSAPVTLLQGIMNQVGKSVKSVQYKIGVERPEVLARLMKENEASAAGDVQKLADEALKVASGADVVIFVGGISPNLEGEEMDVTVEGFSGGDRTNLDIPAEQVKLLEKLKTSGKPIVLVLTNGSALSFGWAKENIPAIVEAWYPGEEGGNALADVLFGRYNPAGRLPVTFYNSVNDLPAFEDYSMEGRTYKYFRGKPLYPFGYGLSYTTFKYSDLKIEKPEITTKDENVVVTLKLTNTGKLDGDEVVQLYFSQPAGLKDQPIKALAAFKRMNVKSGAVADVQLTIPVSQFRHFDTTIGDYKIEPGEYTLLVGGSSDDVRLTGKLTVK